MGRPGVPRRRLRPAARAGSKTDQTAEGTVLYLGPAAVETLLAIRPEEAVIDPGASVFGLSASQIYRRVKAATKMAGLGEGFSAHSPRVGMAQDLSGSTPVGGRIVR